MGAAVVNAALKPVLFDPALDVLRRDVKAVHYADAILIAMHIVGLYLMYKAIAWMILGVFNNSVIFRQFLDKEFDVEGAYFETVFIAKELEVVGRSEIKFKDGELKLESHVYWPHSGPDGSLILTPCAEVISVDDMCSVKDREMQYVFQDRYREASVKDKTGLTKLHFFREQHPSFWRKLVWRRGRLTEYSGRFDAYENTLEGSIVGMRLSRAEAKLSRNESERTRMLLQEVKLQIGSGKILRTTPPGE